MNNPARYTDPSGHMVDDGYVGNHGPLDCQKYGEYCHNGKPKPPDELAKLRNKSIDGNVPDNKDGTALPIPNPLIDVEPRNLAEEFFGYQYTPLAMGAMQILTATAYDAIPLLLVLGPAMIEPVAYIEGGLIVANRAASVVGLASTNYQYEHNLHGATLTDVQVAIATTVIGTVGASNPTILTVASYFSFGWTATHTDLRPLFQGNP